MGQYLNPLHTVAYVSAVLKTTGKLDLTRNTGRTTANVLGTIVEAIRAPHREHTVPFHAGEPNSYTQCKSMQHYAYKLIGAMGLKEIYVDIVHNTVRITFGKLK